MNTARPGRSGINSGIFWDIPHGLVTIYPKNGG
jgi:hypothetical protein